MLQADGCMDKGQFCAWYGLSREYMGSTGAWSACHGVRGSGEQKEGVVLVEVQNVDGTAWPLVVTEPG